MDFYWVYNISNWAFFLTTIIFFIVFSLLGAFLFSSNFEKKLGLTIKNNSIVAIFLELSGVFMVSRLG